MSGIRCQTITVTTVGSTGAATGTTDTGLINGRLDKIILNFDAGNHANTTLNILTKTGSQVFQETIYSKASAKTNVILYPRINTCTSAGVATANTGDPYDAVALSGPLTFTLTLTNALAPALTVDVFWESD